MRVAILSLMLLGASPAAADPARDIAMKAAECWSGFFTSIPEGKPLPEFEVVLDAEGYLKDATVKNYTDETSEDRVFVLVALRAIQKCAPYETSAGDTLQVTLDPADIPKRGIDPFKQ